LLSVALSAACDGGPLGVEQPGPDPTSSCELPAALLGIGAAPPAEPAAVRAAFAHAATAMSLSLPAGPPLDLLRQSLLVLSQGFGDDEARDCRNVGGAWTLFQQVPSTPASLPDREGIELTLVVAARILARGA
jgi:hypothetical protein